MQKTTLIAPFCSIFILFYSIHLIIHYSFLKKHRQINIYCRDACITGLIGINRSVHWSSLITVCIFPHHHTNTSSVPLCIWQHGYLNLQISPENTSIHTHIDAFAYIRPELYIQWWQRSAVAEHECTSCQAVLNKWGKNMDS